MSRRVDAMHAVIWGSMGWVNFWRDIAQKCNRGKKLFNPPRTHLALILHKRCGTPNYCYTYGGDYSLDKWRFYGGQRPVEVVWFAPRTTLVSPERSTTSLPRFIDGMEPPGSRACRPAACRPAECRQA
jgi:hypothetical protein